MRSAFGYKLQGFSAMYEYRNMTPEQQRAVLEERKRRGYPKHSPPHVETAAAYRIISGACYEHRHHLNSHERLLWFEQELFQAVAELGTDLAAWCVLPNHYLR